MNPTEALRHHVTGAIERGEAEPITEIAAQGPALLCATADGNITPAPWTLGDDVQATPDHADELWDLRPVVGADGDTIGFVGNADPNPADINLILAAPLLRQTLEDIADSISHDCPGRAPSLGRAGPCGTQECDIWWRCINALRASWEGLTDPAMKG